MRGGPAPHCVSAQGLGNLRELAASPVFSWLNPILDALGPGMEAFLNAYLPSLLLVLLLSAVPPILRRAAVREGHLRNLVTEEAIMGRFYLFLVFNVFLVSTIAGSALAQLEAILEGEVSLAELLATSLPAQGPFFIEYLLVKFCYVTMDLLRPHILLFFALKALGRPAATNDYVVEYRSTIDYGPRFGWDLIVVAISLTFSVMYPFILIFTVAYFAVVAIVHRHNIIFLHRPRLELQGQLWPRVKRLYFIGVFIFLLTMLGWFSLRSSPALIFPALGMVVVSVAWYKINRITADAPDLLRWLPFRHHQQERRALLKHAENAAARRPSYGAADLVSASATGGRAAMASTASSEVGGLAAGTATSDATATALLQMATAASDRADARSLESGTTADHSESDVLDDDDYDGVTAHGRFSAAEAELLYFLEPIMQEPAPDLVDDPYNPLAPQP